LYADQPAFPGAEPQKNDGQENHRNPEIAFTEAHDVGDNERDGSGHQPHKKADLARVHHVFAQQRLHLVQVVRLQPRIVVAENMNLRSFDALGFQVVFQPFQVVQVVT
jgi:hypothetical protein